MSDPVAVRILVARFVTETCEAARKREKARALREEEEHKGAVVVSPVRILTGSQPSKSGQQLSDLAHPPPPPPLKPAADSEVDAKLQFERISSFRRVTLYAGPVSEIEIRKENICNDVPGNCS